MMNKDSLVWNLRIIIPGVDNAGSVSMWGFHALDATHWFLLMATLKHPAKMTPDRPSNEQEADRDASQSTPPSTTSSITNSTLNIKKWQSVERIGRVLRVASL